MHYQHICMHTAITFLLSFLLFCPLTCMHTHPWRVKMRFNLHIYFLLLICWAMKKLIARKEKYEHAEFVSFRKVEAAVRPIKITAGRT